MEDESSERKVEFYKRLTVIERIFETYVIKDVRNIVSYSWNSASVKIKT